MSRSWKWGAACVLCCVALAAILIGPVPQSLAYHHFADQRTLLGIPHGLDVLSNIGFLMAGVWGMGFVLFSPRSAFLSTAERWCYLFFFVGVGLTAFGSSYYHLAPDNARLVWDRAPMAMGFMALLAAVLDERVRPGLASGTLAPLVSMGVVSVFYWRWTEAAGHGDLRLYAVVQFGSLAAVVLACAFLPSRYTHGSDMFVVVALYALAKVFEALDKPIFALDGVVSGHTLKHLAAALACFWVLRMLKRRKPKAVFAG